MLDTLLHDLDSLGIQDSIEYLIILPEGPINGIEGTKINRDDEYQYLFDINESIKNKIRSASGKVVYKYSFNQEIGGRNPYEVNYSMLIKIEWDTKIRICFSNGMMFTFTFNENGILNTIAFNSTNPKHYVDRCYLSKDNRLMSDNKYSLNNCMLGDDTISKLMIDSIKEQYPERWNEIKHNYGKTT